VEEMTRKHFEWAAEYTREERRIAGDKAAEAVQVAFRAMFHHFGTRFDAGRFDAACKRESK
jgi:hypothetical protein